MPVTRVLHRAGNVAQLHHLATHPAVDALEADIWVRGEDLLAHHERPLGPLPIGLNGWLPGRLPPPVRLEEILDALHGRAGFVIDLRSWFGDPAPDLVRVLAPLATREHLRVTCEAWVIADRIREWLPDLDVAYSIRSERQLLQYLTARDRGLIRPTPVVVRHSLLHTADEVDVLRRRAGRVGAWTVDDIDRAIELVEWGIDDLVSNHVVVLNSV